MNLESETQRPLPSYGRWLPGKQLHLATYLLAEEQARLSTHISESGSSDWITIHPCILADTNGSSPKGHETLVISRKSAHKLKPYSELITAHFRGQRIIDVGHLVKEIRGRVDLETADAWSFLLGLTYQSPTYRLYFYLKALLEPIMAVLLVILLAPLFAMIAIAIQITNGGPILYRQERLGFHGAKFNLLKFRTMLPSAELSGPQWASVEDPRVTRMGRWLRKTRLDELPQIINVASGVLSFVGPRPERPEFYKRLNEAIPLFSLRQLVRPGITGWAQVNEGYAASVEECKAKLEYDLFYIQRMSPQMDFRILLRTFSTLLKGNSGR